MSVREKKLAAITRLYELFGKYSTIVFVTLDNVGSNQVQQVRRELTRNEAQLVIGKNTIIKKALQYRIEGLPDTEDFADLKRRDGKTIKALEILRDQFKGKVGLVFTNTSKTPIYKVKQIVESNKIAAPAKVGMISYLDVVVPAGPTGMEPSQISFFHALNISTKINKGQIEIAKDYQVCAVGRKIGSSEVTLLQKMNIKPFAYQMNVVSAYDDGAILDAATCKISPDDIIGFFQTGVRNLTAFSLQTGYATQLSVSHAIQNAFKNLAAIGLSIDYKFAQIANAQAQVAVAASKPAETGKAKEESKPKEEPKEEEEGDFDMGDLFG